MRFYAIWLLCVLGIGAVCGTLQTGSRIGFIAGAVITIVFLCIDEYRLFKRRREVMAIVQSFKDMYDHQMSEEEADSLKNSEFTPLEPDQCQILPAKTNDY